MLPTLLAAVGAFPWRPAVKPLGTAEPPVLRLRALSAQLGVLKRANVMPDTRVGPPVNPSQRRAPPEIGGPDFYPPYLLESLKADRPADAVRPWKAIIG
jgi:hypothetical protein